MVSLIRIAFPAVLISIILGSLPIHANQLPQPKGEVILTVTGEDIITNAENMAHFDLEMLQELGVTTFETNTIWTNGVQQFKGVLLLRLLETLGIESGSLNAQAVNDYSTNIPVSDAVEDGPIIAYELNGKPMSLRDKGPLWIVYPFDSNDAYLSEVIYTRSIWQLDRIEVLK